MSCLFTEERVRGGKVGGGGVVDVEGMVDVVWMGRKGRSVQWECVV